MNIAARWMTKQTEPKAHLLYISVDVDVGYLNRHLHVLL